MNRKNMAIGFILWIVSFPILLKILPFSDLSIYIALFFSLAMFIMPSIIDYKINDRNPLSKQNIQEAIETLHDPDEILKQTDKKIIRKYIQVFKYLGYNNIAKEYQNFIQGKKYNFSKLPSPEEIKINLKNNSTKSVRYTKKMTSQN